MSDLLESGSIEADSDAVLYSSTDRILRWTKTADCYARSSSARTAAAGRGCSTSASSETSAGLKIGVIINNLVDMEEKMAEAKVKPKGRKVSVK